MTIPRREFLLGLVSGTATFGRMANGSGHGSTRPSDNTTVLTTLDSARRAAAHRNRRVIFNNDGDDIWVQGADTVAKFLDVRHTPLLKTHVGSIHYCTTQSFNLFTHQTKVAEVFRSQEGSFSGNNIEAFLKKDTDGLRMSSGFARQHGLESVWTLRMNDIHDSWTAPLVSQWKRDDRSRVMSSQEETKSFQDRRRLWSLVDFEHPDVEPRLLEIIEEVLRNYSVDGIELDFLRAPFYFKSSYEGRPATEAQVALLTKLVRNVRAIVLRESMRLGMPLLLEARVPSTPKLCRHMGIDITTWLQEKLIDVMSIGGGYITFDLGIDDMIALAKKHDVPVYPCLSQSGLMYRPPRGTGTKKPPEAWFGAATRLWHKGAAGMYVFNLFSEPGNSEDVTYSRQVLEAIGSVDEIGTKTIMHSISDAGSWMPSHFWAKDVEEFSEALPLSLRPNEFERRYLHVAEDLAGAGFDVAAELRVDFTGLGEDSAPEILFGSANFGPTGGGTEVAGVRRYVCRVPVQAIQLGPNRVMVKTKASGAKLVGAELWVLR